jgi:hypothetical protein
MPDTSITLRDKIADLEDENSRLQRQKQWYKGRLQSIVAAVVVGDPNEDQTDESSVDEDDDFEEEDA